MIAMCHWSIGLVAPSKKRVLPARECPIPGRRRHPRGVPAAPCTPSGCLATAFMKSVWPMEGRSAKDWSYFVTLVVGDSDGNTAGGARRPPSVPGSSAGSPREIPARATPGQRPPPRWPDKAKRPRRQLCAGHGRTVRAGGSVGAELEELLRRHPGTGRMVRDRAPFSCVARLIPAVDRQDRGRLRPARDGTLIGAFLAQLLFGDVRCHAARTLRAPQDREDVDISVGV
jgi:hypothetical protein